MHDGQAGRVGQIKLGDREGAAVAIPEAHWPQALDDLAQRMRDPLEASRRPRFIVHSRWIAAFESVSHQNPSARDRSLAMKTSKRSRSTSARVTGVRLTIE